MNAACRIGRVAIDVQSPHVSPGCNSVEGEAMNRSRFVVIKELLCVVALSSSVGACTNIQEDPQEEVAGEPVPTPGGVSSSQRAASDGLRTPPGQAALDKINASRLAKVLHFRSCPDCDLEISGWATNSTGGRSGIDGDSISAFDTTDGIMVDPTPTPPPPLGLRCTDDDCAFMSGYDYIETDDSTWATFDLQPSFGSSYKFVAQSCQFKLESVTWNNQGTPENTADDQITSRTTLSTGVDGKGDNLLFAVSEAFMTEMNDGDANDSTRFQQSTGSPVATRYSTCQYGKSGIPINDSTYKAVWPFEDSKLSLKESDEYYRLCICPLSENQEGTAYTDKCNYEAGINGRLWFAMAIREVSGSYRMTITCGNSNGYYDGYVDFMVSSVENIQSTPANTTPTPTPTPSCENGQQVLSIMPDNDGDGFQSTSDLASAPDYMKVCWGGSTHFPWNGLNRTLASPLLSTSGTADDCSLSGLLDEETNPAAFAWADPNALDHSCGAAKSSTVGLTATRRVTQLSPDKDHYFFGGSRGDFTARYVHGIGDLNADPRTHASELLIADQRQNGDAYSSALTLVYGSGRRTRGGMPSDSRVLSVNYDAFTTPIRFWSPYNPDMGISASSGYLDGDKHVDLVLGTPSAGTVHVIYGPLPVTDVTDTTSLIPENCYALGDNLIMAVGKYVNEPSCLPLHYGEAGFPSSLRYAQLISENIGDRFGEQVSVGDADGDGTQDLLISAPAATVGSQAHAGRAYLLMGGTAWFGPLSIGNSTLLSKRVVFEGTGADDYLGQVAQLVPSLYGEATDESVPPADVVLGSPYWDDRTTSTALTDAGVVFVMKGGSQVRSHLGGAPVSLTTSSMGAGFLGSAEFDLIGLSATGSGDLDGDGYGELVIGSSNLFDEAGAIYLVFGKSTTPISGEVRLGTSPGTTGATWLTFKGSSGAGLGSRLGTAGNINGDIGTAGKPLMDLVAVGQEGTLTQILLWRGRSRADWTSLASTGYVGAPSADVVIRSTDSTDQLGTTQPVLSDLDGDGYSDFVLAAPSASTGISTWMAGAAYVVYGHH